MKKKNLSKTKKISTRYLFSHGKIGRSTDEFIKIARMIHGDRFSYERAIYRGYRTHVELICPEHGPFSITPDALFSKLRGCPACGRESRTLKHTKPYKDFLAQAKALYGKKYTYDEKTYRNSRQKIKVICPLHGEFRQSPSQLLNGYSCPQCGKHKPMNSERFFREAKEIHGDKYDYSKVSEITGVFQYIKIICPKHGEFTQQVYCHISGGQGCPKCGIETIKEKIRIPFTEFLKRARKAHGSKYQYDEALYIDSCTKIPITCPVHGVFMMVPQNHISQRQGCPKCGLEIVKMKQRLPFEDFIRRARKAHGNKYKYDKASYVCLSEKTSITCPRHGEFRQTAADHIDGHGCPVCGRESTTAKRRLSFAEFISRAREIHGEKYEYDEASYTFLGAKLTIICPKHGPFRQTGESHLIGRGCPECGRQKCIASGRSRSSKPEINNRPIDP
jgi:predicted  nucleic acid-binding Zn-ribbon protein